MHETRVCCGDMRRLLKKHRLLGLVLEDLEEGTNPQLLQYHREQIWSELYPNIVLESIFWATQIGQGVEQQLSGVRQGF